MKPLLNHFAILEQKRKLCEEKIEELRGYIHSFSLPQVDEIYTCIGVCINSNLFRGVLHPSPTRDIIVGGAKRGKFVSRNTITQNVSHRYFLNRKNQLIRVESIRNQEIGLIEHLFYENNKRIGITTDQKNRICGISEEVFDNEQIVSFAHLSYFEIDQNRFIGHMEWEEFKYNENGIFACDYVPSFSPKDHLFAFSRYRIESQNGSIVSYINEKGTLYTVEKKRDSFGYAHYLK